MILSYRPLPGELFNNPSASKLVKSPLVFCTTFWTSECIHRASGGLWGTQQGDLGLFGMGWGDSALFSYLKYYFKKRQTYFIMKS